MNPKSLPSAARSTLLAWGLLSLAASAAHAGTLQEVEVRGHKLPVAQARGDVSKVCPAIQQQLPEALAGAYNEERRDAVVQVQMRLQGQRIVQVMPISGPRSYHRHVRSAMSAVDCRSDRSDEQVFAFAVRFGTPLPGQQASATLLEAAPR